MAPSLRVAGARGGEEPGRRPVGSRRRRRGGADLRPHDFDLRFLGGARVTRAGRPVEPETRRTGLLLAHLAVHGAPRSRASLAAWFWPDRDRTAGLANLRPLLSWLRRDVGPLLDIGRTEVRLVDEARQRVDVHRFERAADLALASLDAPDAGARLDRALAEHDGPLLDGVEGGVAIGESLESWLEAERTRLRLRLVELLEARVDLDLEQGPDARTVGHAQRLVALDPLREASQHRRLRAQWQTGDRAGALADHDRWRAHFEAELQVPVSAGLARLVRTVRQREVAVDPPAPSPDPTAWPFVGRSRECDALARVVAGGRPAAVLVGPTGSGKTRLLAEVVGHVEDRLVRRVAATSATARLAHGALVAVTGPLPADPTAAHAAAVAALAGPAGGPAPLVVVDDAHLLDDHSAAVLLQLAVSGRATVLVATRPWPEPPEAVRALWRDGHGPRLDLGPLTLEEIAALLPAALGGPVARPTVHRLAEASGGNFLYLRELVRGAREAGTLRRRRGRWSWDGQVVVDARLQDTVGRRLEDLSAPTRDALALVALAEPVDLELLGAVAGDEPIEELERRGLVAVAAQQDAAVVRLAHPLYGEVAVERVGAVRRRRLLHDLLARADGSASGESLARSADAQLDAGLPVGGETLGLAAEAALAHGDLPRAERLARAAVTTGATGRAVVVLGRVLTTTNRRVEACDLLAAHGEEVLADDDPGVVTAYLRLEMGTRHFGLGQVDEVLEVLERAASRRREQPGVVDVADGLRVGVLRNDGRAAEAVDLGRRFVDVGTDATALAGAAGAVFAAAIDHADLALAEAVTDRMVEAVDDDHGAGAVSGRLWARVQRLYLLLDRGRLDVLLPRLRAFVPDVLAGDDRDQVGTVGTLYGQVCLAAGNVAAATEVLAEAAEALLDVDWFGGRAVTLCLLGHALALGGHVAEAAEVLDEADRVRRPHPTPRFDHHLVPARAQLAVASGETDEARRSLEVAVIGASGRRAIEARLRHLAVLAGAEPDPHARRLRSLADASGHPVVARRARHVEAVARGDGDALTALGDELAGWDQWAWAAQAHADGARVARDPRARDAAERRARAAAGRCSGAVHLRWAG